MFWHLKDISQFFQILLRPYRTIGMWGAWYMLIFLSQMIQISQFCWCRTAWAHVDVGGRIEVGRFATQEADIIYYQYWAIIIKASKERRATEACRAPARDSRQEQTELGFGLWRVNCFNIHSLCTEILPFRMKILTEYKKFCVTICLLSFKYILNLLRIEISKVKFLLA